MQNCSENGFPRFFNIEKVSYGKYKMIEIYEKPLDISNSKKAGNASIYLFYIELIMLRYLVNDYDKETVFSRKRLWKLLGMINEKYGMIKNEQLQKLDKSITPFEIDNFYFRANHKLDRILKVALKNLSDRSLIDVTPKTVICKIINGYEKHVPATDEEVATILSVNRKILDEFNCETISQVILKKLHKEFYKRVNDILFNGYNWKYYYKAYKIIFNYDDINRFIPRLEMNLKDALCGLNLEIIKSLNLEAEKLYNNKLKEYNERIDAASTEDEFSGAIRFWHYPMNYVIAQQILANELINISDRDKDIRDIMCLDMELKYDGVDNDLESLFFVDE